MQSLDLEQAFSQLAAHLREGAGLSASRSDPFYYFVFPPEQTLDVKRNMRAWTARLRYDGIVAEQVSFSELLWGLVDESDRWDEWLQLEPEVDRADVNEAVRSLLRQDNALVRRVAARMEALPPGHVLFLTDAELLHPYFRVRALENALHDQVNVPTVVLYPGRRDSQFGLYFLGFYPVDANYRATILGGMA